MGINTETPVLTVSDLAKQQILAVLQAQDPPVSTIRVSAPARGRYAMNIEPEGKPDLDDTVLSFDGFQVFVDSLSLPWVEGAQLDYVETINGAGFQFTNPNDAPRRIEPREAPEGPEGDLWRRIQEVLDSEVNPAVASHGGHISLIEVREGSVFLQMGGGCQGCGMAAATLKQGVERILKGHFPEIQEILDVTDHAAGRNPYYAGAR